MKFPLLSVQVEDKLFRNGELLVLPNPWRAEYTDDDKHKITFVLDHLQIHGVQKVPENAQHRTVYCQFADVGSVLGVEISSATQADDEDQENDPEMYFVEVQFRLANEETAKELFQALASALSVIDEQQQPIEEESSSDVENENFDEDQ